MTTERSTPLGENRERSKASSQATAGRELDARLADICERWEMATPGEWVWETGCNGAGPDDGTYQHVMAIRDGLCIGGICDTYHKPSMKLPWAGKLEYLPATHGRPENAHFIANAHQDIPYLLGVIADLRSALSSFPDSTKEGELK